MLEELKLYLPKYLSAASEKELFDTLKQFPPCITADKIYTQYLKADKIVYQGDGIKNMLAINLPDETIAPVSCMILSNTCDIDPSNPRFFNSRLLYAPIFKLAKYQNLLHAQNYSEQQIEGHISSIKKQLITQIFYLPELESSHEESIVFLDRINNISNDYIDRNHIEKNRLFTLSDYGAYLFVLKLSIHFTRIQDRVERRNIGDT